MVDFVGSYNIKLSCWFRLADRGVDLTESFFIISSHLPCTDTAKRFKYSENLLVKPSYYISYEV